MRKLRLYVKVLWYRLKGWKIVYKVCKERPDGSFTSAVVINYSVSLSVLYEIDQISLPPLRIPDSKLFCFSNLNDASSFAMGGVFFRTLFCLAKVDPSALNRIAPPYRPEIYEPFWIKELENADILTQKPPQGTVFCDEVLPIKVVEY